MAAYEQRYHRQLRDIGVATALAQHDPQKLDQLAPPAAAKPLDNGSKWW